MINITIYDGTSYVWLNCDTSELRDVKTKTPEQIYARLKFTGSITIFKDSYQLVDDILENEGSLASVKIYLNGESFNGTIDLEQNENIDFKYKDLEVKVIDEYSNFDEKGEIEYNYLLTEPNSTLDPIVIPENTVYEYTGSESSTLHVGLVFPYTVAPVAYSYAVSVASTEPTFDVSAPNASWGLISAVYTLESIVNPVENAGVDLTGDASIRLNQQFAREIKYGQYDGATKSPPSGTGWVYIDDVDVGVNTFPRYGRPPQGLTWTNTSVSSISVLSTVAGVFLSDCQTDFESLKNSYTYEYERWRFLKDVIEYMVGEIDSSVLFDSTGTSTDSFYFNNTYIGNDFVYDVDGTSYPNTTYNTPFKWLVLMPLPNAIPQSSGAEPDIGNQTSTLTFNSLMRSLNNMGFKWYLEDRVGLWYFVLTHEKIISNSLSTVNLADFNNHNFTDLKFDVEIEKPEFNRVVNKELARNIDFTGFDIEFSKVNIDNESTYSDDRIRKDIDSIRNDGANVYDDYSLTESVMLSIQPYKNTGGNDMYILRSPTGVLTGLPSGNSDLSWSYISANLNSDLPSATATVNGASVTLADFRLKKRKSVNLDFLGQKISDIEFEKNIDFRSAVSEIAEYSVKNNFLKLNVGNILYYYYTQLDGINEYIDCGSASDLNFNGLTDALSISGWSYKTAYNPFDSILSKYDYVADVTIRGWAIGITQTGVIRFFIRNYGVTNGIDVSTVEIASLNQWNHIAVTYDGSGNTSGVNIYINGVAATKTINANNLTLSTTTTKPVQIGELRTGLLYEGKLDEISAYNTELSSSTILDLSNLGRRNPDISGISGLVSHWRMDDINPIDEAGANNGTGVNIDASNIIEWS